MQIEADREELQAAVLDTMDDGGKVHLENVEANLDTVPGDKDYWEQDEQDSTVFTKHHKNGDANIFTVTIDANGGFTITYIEPQNSGEEPKEPEEEDEGNPPTIEFVSPCAGLIGSIVTINDIEYVVMSKDEENGTVDLVAYEGIGELTLGYEDENYVSDLEILKSISNTNHEYWLASREININTSIGQIIGRIKYASASNVKSDYGESICKLDTRDNVLDNLAIAY